MLKKLVPLSVAAIVYVGAPFHTSANEMSASDILAKSSDAMTEVKSYSTEMKTEQSSPIEGESMMTSSQAKADITLEPFAMHQTMTTSSPQQGEITLESYWTEEGFYQEDPEKGWVKMPEELTQDLEKLQGMSTAKGQMAQAKELAKEMKVEDTDDAYVLTYEGDGETLLESSMKMLTQNMSENEESPPMEGLMEQITINNVNYNVTIDKETYYVQHIMMDLDMEMTIEDKTMNMKQSMEMSLTNYNQVGTITIPQDVIDSAVPLEPTEEGGELPDTATPYPTLALSGLALIALGGSLLVFRRLRVTI
ncbi:DUF6612 family protein [Alkalihalobacillus sp. R86527]|uniref:DUF6612 family protein n=1 Tax=Alkalihalobacillus sp. R86527 TaxID=3093863 RepID=UPI00366D7290